MQHASYGKFFVMLLVSFCIMYAVMFLNVDDAGHIYLSLTRTYMSLLMVSPMAILMMVMMGKMYPDKKRNGWIITASIAVFVLSLILLRTQTPVGGMQYMRAMIPHHSSAIMTSRHADIRDPELKQLSESIIASQEKEIAEMKTIMERMKMNVH